MSRSILMKIQILMNYGRKQRKTLRINITY
jgi:hypothetical protein